MNCKPGDMAIVIKCPSTPSFIGRIVEVLHPDNRFDVPHWRTAPDLIDPADGCRVVFADECLRPISGLPLSDDASTQASKPSDIKTKEIA